MAVTVNQQQEEDAESTCERMCRGRDRVSSEQEFTSLGFEELEDKIPFLQKLQNVESQSFKQPNFQNLVKLQHFNKPGEEGVGKIQELVQLYSSPINSETKDQDEPPNSKETRKRKRWKATKNKEEVESQRMTHIAVERNRRRQMNDHLHVIKSLIPTSYIQRGDQASIIGGAIEFVKELEQLLEVLEAQRKGRKGADSGCKGAQSEVGMGSNGRIGGVCAEMKSEVGEIEVTMIQTHVSLKIRCPKRQGQLLKAIVGLEDLRLSVLHLNITTSQATATMLYSFNLKIEDECKLGSAEQIAGAVHQIFSFINDGSQVKSMRRRKISGRTVAVADYGRKGGPLFLPPYFPSKKKERKEESK
ncbi:Transcription factor basic helix-loop-helix 70, partial [Cucurbita argyrosperma subsp. sororia]